MFFFIFDCCLSANKRVHKEIVQWFTGICFIFVRLSLLSQLQFLWLPNRVIFRIKSANPDISQKLFQLKFGWEVYKWVWPYVRQRYTRNANPAVSVGNVLPITDCFGQTAQTQVGKTLGYWTPFLLLPPTGVIRIFQYPLYDSIIGLNHQSHKIMDPYLTKHAEGELQSGWGPT